MAKDKKAKVTESEEIAPPEGTGRAPVEETQPVPPAGRSIRTQSCTVTLPNGTSRVYSQKTHGKVWEVLAKNYAKAHKGEIE